MTLFLHTIQMGFCISVNKLSINWLFVTRRLLLLNVGYNNTLIRRFYSALMCGFVQGPVRRRMEGGFYSVGSIFQGSKKYSTEYSYKQKLMICWKEHIKMYTFCISPMVSKDRLCSLFNSFLMAKNALLPED